MKAKFVNETLNKDGFRRYRKRHEKIKLPGGMQEEFKIPDWALMYDGINAPEAAEYVDDRLQPGDVTANFQGEPMVVIYKDENGTLATHAHNISDHDYHEGIDESVYTSGDITDNEYLDGLYEEKDYLLDALEAAQEMGHSAENIRMIGQELAAVEEKIKAEEMEMAELREM